MVGNAKDDLGTALQNNTFGNAAMCNRLQQSSIAKAMEIKDEVSTYQRSLISNN
jgi:hypothetical protein